MVVFELHEALWLIATNVIKAYNLIHTQCYYEAKTYVGSVSLASVQVAPAEISQSRVIVIDADQWLSRFWRPN